MLDSIDKALGDSINSILGNQYVQWAIQAIVVYIILVWLLTAFWAFRDMQHRTTNPVAPYLAAGLVIAFTPFLFLFAVLLYRIIRPRETISESNERALAEEAILAEIEVTSPLRELFPRGGRGMDHLPHVPQPSPPRVPQLQPPRGARLDPVRLVRQGLRAAGGGRARVHARPPAPARAAPRCRSRSMDRRDPRSGPA